MIIKIIRLELSNFVETYSLVSPDVCRRNGQRKPDISSRRYININHTFDIYMYPTNYV